MHRETNIVNEKAESLPRGATFYIYSNYTVAIAIALFSIAVYAASWQIPEVSESLATSFQPASYPRAIIIVMLFLAGLIALFGGAMERPEPMQNLTYLTLAGMALALLGCSYVDPFLSMFLFVAVMAVVWGFSSIAWAGVYALIVTVSVYVLFSVILQVRFPRGVLSNIFG
jgi:hypothetical protein